MGRHILTEWTEMQEICLWWFRSFLNSGQFFFFRTKHSICNPKKKEKRKKKTFWLMGQKCFPEYLFSNLVSSSEYFIQKQARQWCVWICLQIYAFLYISVDYFIVYLVFSTSINFFFNFQIIPERVCEPDIKHSFTMRSDEKCGIRLKNRKFMSRAQCYVSTKISPQ